MKLRVDFVTNSSSSSFILSKVGDTRTVNDVYLILRDIYIKMFNNRDELLNNIDGLGLVYEPDHNNRNAMFTWNNAGKAGGLSKTRMNQIEYLVKDAYNIDLYQDIPIKRPEWLKFDSYKDYENYWLDFYRSNPKTGVCAPFSIRDLSSSNLYYPLEDGVGCLSEGRSSLEEIEASNLLGWYCPCVFVGTEKYCDTACDTYDFLDEDELASKKIGELLDKNDDLCMGCFCDDGMNIDRSSICDELRENAARIGADKPTFVAELLGKICIHSNSGWMPEHVVKELEKVSRFSCEHMG